MSVKTNYPTDTDNTMYIAMYGTMSMAEILSLAERKWPGEDLDNIQIEIEHRHVTCIGYDRYDPSDYTNYLVITKQS